MRSAHVARGSCLALLACTCFSVPAVHGQTSSTPARVAVTFVVHAPESTPAGESLHIPGNVPELGPWDPGRHALARLDARTHTTTIALPAGFPFEFKITRGSWETVEKGPHGEEIANRRHAVARAETVVVRVATWRDQVEVKAAPRGHTWTGDVRHLGRVQSAALGNERDVWVWLPPSYATPPDRRYPVVYFHDGQNVFDAATAFIGVEWGADETLARLAETGEAPEAIAVAVANTPQRMLEYTQASDPRHPGEPRADLYLRFLVEELKPRIDAEFRTLPERAHTALVGSSLGGLVSLYAGTAAWETFGLVAGVSPVLHWGGHDLESHYRTAPRQRLPLRLWIDMGTAEDAAGAGPDSRLVRELRRFRDVLVERGYVEGRDLGYLEDAGAAHNEHAWAARLPRVLRFLLAASPDATPLAR